MCPEYTRAYGFPPARLRVPGTPMRGTAAGRRPKAICSPVGFHYNVCRKSHDISDTTIDNRFRRRPIASCAALLDTPGVMTMSRTKAIGPALLFLFAVSACGERTEVSETIRSLTEIASPADSGSGEPNLFVASGGDVYVSWIEPKDEGHALRFARIVRSEEGKETWSAPLTIATGKNWFVNWADFPSIVVFANGDLAAHWLQKNGEDPYAYSVMISRSADGGRTWSPPVTPHRDGTQTEHGFVSMLPRADGKLRIVWLDGRNFAKTGSDHDGAPSAAAMTLRSAVMDAEGRLSDEAVLDDRVCDCCQTGLAWTPTGAIVAYRDRSADEIRDISVVRLTDDSWTEPANVFPDGWELPGCPVNGPAIASDEEGRVVVAWYTIANNSAQVKVAFSDDEGETFGLPVRVDDGDPTGRVDVLLLSDGGALVCWIEAGGEDVDVRLRYVTPGKWVGASTVITPSSIERSSGFPIMARRGNDLFFAWTDAQDDIVVRTAVAELRDLEELAKLE